jgi:hypothetical protein
MKYFKLLSIAVIFVLTSCSQKPQDLIVGQWTRTSIDNENYGLFYPSTITFYKEGTVSVGGEEIITTVAGNYHFIDDNNIKLDITGFASVIVKAQVSKKELILTFPKGENAKYKKEEN